MSKRPAHVPTFLHQEVEPGPDGYFDSDPSEYAGDDNGRDATWTDMARGAGIGRLKGEGLLASEAAAIRRAVCRPKPG